MINMEDLGAGELVGATHLFYGSSLCGLLRNQCQFEALNHFLDRNYLIRTSDYLDSSDLPLSKPEDNDKPLGSR
jgi:hypothetical protein